MYKVMLYFSFGNVIATGDASKKEHLTFDTLEEAEEWARGNSGLAMYEVFKVKEEK